MTSAPASSHRQEPKVDHETENGSNAGKSPPRKKPQRGAGKPQGKPGSEHADSPGQDSPSGIQFASGTVSPTNRKGRPLRSLNADRRPWLQGDFRARHLRRGGVPTRGSPPASRHASRNQGSPAAAPSGAADISQSSDDLGYAVSRSATTATFHRRQRRPRTTNAPPRAGVYKGVDTRVVATKEDSVSTSPGETLTSSYGSPSGHSTTGALSGIGQETGLASASPPRPGDRRNLAGTRWPFAKAAITKALPAGTLAPLQKDGSPRAEPLGGEPPAASPINADVAAAGDGDLGPFPDDEEYFGQYVDRGVSCWLRVWVLCSVTAIVLMIPLSFTLLSYRAASRDHSRNPTRRTRPPTVEPETVPESVAVSDNLVLYDDAAGRPDNCSFLPDYSNVPAIPTLNVAGVNESEILSLRRVFCVLDTFNLTTAFAHFVPYAFCTDIIVYSMYYDSAYEWRMKRRTGTTPGSGLPYLGSALKHRRLAIKLYATYGGSRADSAAIALSTTRSSAILLVQKIRMLLIKYGYTGINLDWDHPNDNCDFSKGEGYIRFIQQFSPDDEVLLTVAPDKAIIQRDYSLLSLLTRVVKFVIIATHRLRPSGFVYCTGARMHAAAVFSDIRKTLGGPFKDRLAYSVALGADLYFAKKKKLGEPGIAVSRFYDPTEGKMKLSYDAVCNVPASAATSECILTAIGGGNSSGYEVAVFAGVQELMERFRASHDDGMGRLPVAVYDIELDDHNGACSFAMNSPLLATIAGTGSI